MVLLSLFTDCVTHRVGQVTEPSHVAERRVLLINVLSSAFVYLFFFRFFVLSYLCLFVMSASTNSDSGSHWQRYFDIAS